MFFSLKFNGLNLDTDFEKQPCLDCLKIYAPENRNAQLTSQLKTKQNKTKYLNK